MAEQPLTKITINLFTADVDELKRLEGQGYQTKIRDIVHAYVQRSKKVFLTEATDANS